jgi:HEAT repeat protein
MQQIIGVRSMGDSYEFDAEHLQSPDEDVRRLAIMHISKERLTSFEGRMLKLLRTEPTDANRRHIVRALGKIGTASSVDTLLEVLKGQKGLILGDAAEALGRLKVSDAVERLRELRSSDVDWIANKARWALNQILHREEDNTPRRA